MQMAHKITVYIPYPPIKVQQEFYVKQGELERVLENLPEGATLVGTNITHVMTATETIDEINKLIAEFKK